MTYDPKNFRDIFNTPMGQKVFRLLSSEPYFEEMRKATDKYRLPAVAAIGDDLLAELGEDVKQPRMKQFCGHAVRYIMESRGYILDAQRIRITCDKVFVSGSRYKKLSNS